MTSTTRHHQRKPLQKNKQYNLGWLKKLIWVLAVFSALTWAITVVWLAKQRIQPLPSGSTHAFITTKSIDPTILIVSQSSNGATLNKLQVWRPNQATGQPIWISLPNNIADTETTAGQYVESGYDKELQQLVEQTLAVPLTDALTLSKSSAPISVEWLKQRATVWNLTVGLPWALRDLPVLHSSLSALDLWHLAWYMRSVPKSDMTSITLLPSSLVSQSGRVQVNTDLSDPSIAKYFALPQVKEQHTSIVIKNATATAGVASLVGRFVRNMGGEVVAVEPADQQSASQSILTSEHSSALTDHISLFLGIPFHAQPSTGRERADVELILGSDVLNRLGQ